MAYKAIIAGASGLIGSNLLTELLASAEYDEVLALVRTELPVQHKKLVQFVIDFEQLGNYASAINGHALFCCMGTTKNKTPDPVQYKKIDHDYPLKLAQLAQQNGVKQCHLVSAVGANKNAKTFYLKLKGELENDMEEVGLPALHIYQPSMLYGNRKEKRFLENVFIALFKVLNPILIGGFKKYRSISGHRVARAMYKNSLKTETGTFIHTYNHIINS